jgi:membrane-bound serine protease (ClpP class)
VQSAVLATLFGAFAYMAVKAQTRPIATGIEGIIGQVGRVTRDLDPDGMVLVAGERWTSITEDGEPIELGAEVEVVSKQGMQLVVRRIVHLDPMV